jgi:hypothetical protein
VVPFTSTSPLTPDNNTQAPTISSPITPDSNPVTGVNDGAQVPTISSPITPDSNPVTGVNDGAQMPTTNTVGPTSTPVIGVPDNSPPIADANGPYETDEGEDVTLDGSASLDPDDDPITFAWDLDDDGAFDDSTDESPVFDMVGQDGVFNVEVQVTDSNTLTDTAESTVTVLNVAPSINDLAAEPSTQDENSEITVSGNITDPGWLDPLFATIDWDDGAGPQDILEPVENDRPDASMSFSLAHTFGDNGDFTVQVCAWDDDTELDPTCEEITVTITNVDPTAEIDETGTVLINGIPTFVGMIGDTFDFTGDSVDPGSDDLTFNWSWDDGDPNPDVSTTSFVNPFDPDPFPSPSIQPRDESDTKSNAFAEACLYNVEFAVQDDDLGSNSDTVAVLVVGQAGESPLVRSAGFWQDQVRAVISDKGAPFFDESELLCYIAITNIVSSVFDESTDVDSYSSLDDANDILKLSKKVTTKDQLLRQLAAAWMNYANGAIALDDLVDTDGDKIPDTLFSQVLTTAENVCNDANSSESDLEEQKGILDNVNTIDSGEESEDEKPDKPPNPNKP